MNTYINTNTNININIQWHLMSYGSSYNINWLTKTYKNSHSKTYTLMQLIYYPENIISTNIFDQYGYGFEYTDLINLYKYHNIKSQLHITHISDEYICIFPFFVSKYNTWFISVLVLHDNINNLTSYLNTNCTNKYTFTHIQNISANSNNDPINIMTYNNKYGNPNLNEFWWSFIDLSAPEFININMNMDLNLQNLNREIHIWIRYIINAGSNYLPKIKILL